MRAASIYEAGAVIGCGDRLACMKSGENDAAKTTGSLDPGPALYIVATPIGNLEDITLRALRVLKEADLIACEDTRQTQKLLSHYGIEKPTVSYHEHNEAERPAELLARLDHGAKITPVSCARMPGITHPA